MLVVTISTLDGRQLAQVPAAITSAGTGLYAGGKVTVNGVKFQIGCNLMPVKTEGINEDAIPAFRKSQLARAFSAAMSSPVELPKPTATAGLASDAPKAPAFVMRADVAMLVRDGRVKAQDAEAFQSLCDSTTHTASQVLAELNAGKKAGSNGKKAVTTKA